jgi:hypothetical protein
MDRREIVWEGVNWIHLSHVREQWRSPVNIMTNLRVA